MAGPRDTDAGRLDEWSPRLLKSRLYQRLLVDIIIGTLAPGEQLDENALAKRYGGGLAGIREALARLALEGLVVRRARVGTSVAPLDLMGAGSLWARRLIEVIAPFLPPPMPAQRDRAIRATWTAASSGGDNDSRAAAMAEAFSPCVRASGNRAWPRWL